MTALGFKRKTYKPCSKCHGVGLKDGLCDRCHGYGSVGLYLINKTLKETREGKRR